MSNSDLLRLAEEAIRAVGLIASALANDTTDRTTTSFVVLSVLLCNFAIFIRDGHVENSNSWQRKIRVVLEEVESALTWPESKAPEQLLTLRAIAKNKDGRKNKPFYRRLQRKPNLHTAVRSSLRKYVISNPNLATLLGLMEDLPTLDKGQVTYGQSFGLYSTFAENGDDIPMYPRRINAELHTVLDLHMSCCDCNHSTRLRLIPMEMQVNDMVLFEVLFSAPSHLPRSTSSIEWRETRMFIPRRDPAPYGPFRTTPSVPSSGIEPGSLCELLGRDQSFMPCFRIDDTTLKFLHHQAPPTPKVESAESIPLSSAFGLRIMSIREKSVLAFIVARSVWQYYESDWMKSPWTHEDIHLLNDQNAAPRGVYDLRGTCRLYLSTSFDNQRLPIPEYCNEVAVLHRYPKVLALGILLIGIMQGSAVVPRHGNFSFDGASINDLFISGGMAYRSGISKDDAVYPSYKDAVKNCLNADLFEGVPDTLEANKALEERRNILYQKVVFPLKRLLEGTGWSCALDEIKHEPLPRLPETPSVLGSTTAISSVSAQAPFRSTPTPSYANCWVDGLDEAAAKVAFLGQMQTPSPEAWLRKFQIASCHMKSATQGDVPVRIAVLDTGCNLDAPVFRFPEFRESVTHRWKDMVNGEVVPTDQDLGSHGTGIVSVLLRIAPNAEIFVARVASNQQTLRESHQQIADAIVYAAKDWDVDVISMSFGFENEITIIKDAIDYAQRIKNQSIVFLAAAGNDGSNSPELFPAYLDSVISIRGTDYTGNFVSSLNPRQHPFSAKGAVYGTLGKDVPHAWPDEDFSKTMTGCSIATPVAAAIVALIINCAATQEFDDSARKLIRTQRAILGVFTQISESQDGRCYLTPWGLCTKDEKLRASILNIAIRKLPAIA